MELPGKPSEMFDRDDEWNDLARFAVDDAAGATLGVVSGRRRQGKTMLLEQLPHHRAAHHLLPGDHAPRLDPAGTRHGAQVWRSARRRFESAVLGPHFEQLCRTWVAEFAAPETFDGIPATVGHGAINDPAGRTSHEVDIVALGDPGAGPRPVLALGETKWGEQMGLAHLDRLRHIRGLLERRPGIDATGAKLLCASGAGFTLELHAAADAGEVTLLDLDRLYPPRVSNR